MTGQGGGGSVTVSGSPGKLSASWSDDVTSVCKQLDFTAANEVATLAAEPETCGRHYVSIVRAPAGN